MDRVLCLVVIVATMCTMGCSTALFNGKSLDGWVQRGGNGVYFVEDGIIVGESRPNQPNSFLCTVEDYADFELDLDFKVDDGMNSGIQIRSASIPP